MRRGISRALSLSGHGPEAGRLGTSYLIWLGLLISLPGFPAEISNPGTDKTLLTTNVIWQGLTNASRPQPSIVFSSNALWRSFTNAPVFQTGMWFRFSPFVLPTTNFTKELHERLLKLRSSFQQDRIIHMSNTIQQLALSNRLGDYWLPGEFQRIMRRPIPITPLNPGQP